MKLSFTNSEGFLKFGEYVGQGVMPGDGSAEYWKVQDENGESFAFMALDGWGPGVVWNASGEIIAKGVHASKAF